MNLTTLTTWEELLSAQNCHALEQLLQDKQLALSLLDRVSQKDVSQCLRDERRLLRLFTLMARHAHWITGELRIVITMRDSIGSCVVSLWDVKDSGGTQCLKNLNIPSSFRELRAIINNTPDLLLPLCLHQTTRGEVVLKASRPETTTSTHAVPPQSPAPVSQRTALGHMPTEKQPRAPLGQRSATERLPRLELDFDAEAANSGRYTFVQPRETPPTIPQPAGPERASTEDEDDIDAGWG